MPIMNTLTKLKYIFSFKFVLLAVVFVGVAIGGYYIFFNKQTPEEKAREELATAVLAVSKYMVLPEGDEPVLAVVTDAETLIKQQAFFTGAVNGDQLLLFPKNMKAIIWSPSRNKIINVGPIEQQQPAAVAVNDQISNPKSETDSTRSTAADTEQASSPQANSSALTVEIRNGTGKTGYASSIAQQLSENAGYKVIKIVDAAKKDYAKNIVVNLTSDKSKSSLVNSLASALGASVDSELPDGENSAEVDALVILGIHDN